MSYAPLTRKDGFVFLLLILIATLILLGLYAVDRQWLKLEQMERSLGEQAEDLQSLRQQIQDLGERLAARPVTPSTTPEAEAQGTASASDPPVPPAFERAYAAAQNEAYARGDWLVQAFAVAPKTLTPLVSSDAYASEVQGYVLESLLVRHPETLEWQGMLAEDWTVSEDGLTITYRLRDGIRFSDGEPVTAKDVAFTFDFIMNESIAAPRQRAYLEKVDNVTAPDPRTVVYQFNEPYFNALALSGGLEVLPEHFYAPYLEEPTEFNESRGLLLGSGPYRVPDPTGWTPDQGRIELVRNPRYWGPVQAPFERLTWQFIENDSARLTTFRNGDIDLYSARPREYESLLEDEALQERTQHLEYMSPTAGYSYIGWNQKRAGEATRFADPRVRRAMTYLTDRARLIEEIMLGYAEPAVSPFNPRSDQHDEAITPREFDLEQAKSLLAEAGFADRDGDAVLEGPEGEPFEFDLIYSNSSQDTERIVLFLKDLYAKAGIVMNPEPSEWSVMIDRINNQDFDAITLGWTSGVETDIYQMFHSSQAISGGDNFINYTNPELDQLIEAARATVDAEERMPIWQEAERVLYEDQPYTFLMRRESLAFIDDRFRNIEVTKLGLNLGLVPVEWYVPADLQRYPR